MYTLEEIKELKAMGFSNAEIVEMNKGEQPEVATAKAVDAPQPKYVAKAKNEVFMERDGQVCRPTYAGGEAPAGVKAYAKDVASAIWYVNHKLIKDKFGDDVEFKAPKRGQEVGYVCKDLKTAKELAKLELKQGVTRDEWNAWCDVKVENLMTEVEQYEAKKL